MDNLENATIVAKKLILSAKFDWLDRVVLRPNQATDYDTGKTVALLSEVESEPARLANNTFKGWTSTIEVQLFYSDKFNYSALQCEVELAKLFTDDNWQIARSEGHDYDPDTKQLMKTFYFRKTIGGI